MGCMCCGLMVVAKFSHGFPRLYIAGEPPHKGHMHISSPHLLLFPPSLLVPLLSVSPTMPLDLQGGDFHLLSICCFPEKNTNKERGRGREREREGGRKGGREGDGQKEILTGREGGREGEGERERGSRAQTGSRAKT